MVRKKNMTKRLTAKEASGYKRMKNKLNNKFSWRGEKQTDEKNYNKNPKSDL